MWSAVTGQGEPQSSGQRTSRAGGVRSIRQVDVSVQTQRWKGPLSLLSAVRHAFFLLGGGSAFLFSLLDEAHPRESVRHSVC